MLFFGASQIPPVLLDGGHHREVVRFVKMLRYPLVSCRYLCIFCKRMHLQYIEAFLVSTLLGLCPKPQPHFVAPQGQAVKTQPPDPVAKCWVGSKASRVKCTASPPLTPLHLRESSKTIRSGWSWKPVKACEATACGLAFTGWRRPNALWLGCRRFSPAPLPRGERGCGQRPRCWQDPWGSRSRGQCAVGTHFKGFGG